ncbi:hypothetical protein R3P38DRAFT_2776486 [Favolaschia claudopus]|uniref:Uncharacterized protein n=1 Tax=Favolaschia claudopus TaxID=2862362 RepID=A0AAW0BLP7_9AGAR
MSFQLPFPFAPTLSAFPPVATTPQLVVVMYVPWCSPFPAPLPVGAAPALPAPFPIYGAPAPPSKAKEPKEPKESVPAAKEKENARPTPGAGLPPALIEHLRTEGPYTANQAFVVVPSQPLTAIEEATPSAEWYAVTRGRFVGVLNHYALSDLAITGVGHGARKAYPSQGEALQAFNDALEWGIVQVV